MPVFSLPTFNLACGIWHGLCPAHVFPPAPPALGPDLTPLCQLYVYSRNQTENNFFSSDGSPSSYNLNSLLRLPPATDVRDVFNASDCDIVEVPIGSNRWYYVVTVEDVHKGFPNEYRVAMISKCFVWPTPVP